MQLNLHRELHNSSKVEEPSQSLQWHLNYGAAGVYYELLGAIISANQHWLVQADDTLHADRKYCYAKLRGDSAGIVIVLLDAAVNKECYLDLLSYREIHRRDPQPQAMFHRRQCHNPFHMFCYKLSCHLDLHPLIHPSNDVDVLQIAIALHYFALLQQLLPPTP